MTEAAEYDHIVVGGGQKYFRNPPKITDITVFEDGLAEICEEKISKLLFRCEQIKGARKVWEEKIRNLNKLGSMEENWMKTWAAAEYSELYFCQRWLIHWAKLWRMATNRPVAKRFNRRKNWLSEVEIEKAKLADISHLFEGKLRRTGNKFMGVCPFHADSSPSFCLYPDGGGYHCFGCWAHGSSIDFVMKVKGLSFSEAVRSLL